MAVPAEVIAIVDRSGAKGIYRVRCKLQDERSRNRVIVRNVLGPVKVGDILMISESEMETATTIG